MPVSILEPGQLEPAAGDFPTRRLPARGLFAARARRLCALAPGHGMAPLLRFASQLAACQEQQWEGLAPPSLPSAGQLAGCRAAGMAPLAAPGWWPAADWHDLVRRLATDVAAVAPAPALLDRVATARGDWLETQARALLAGTGDGLDLAAAPIIGAALQVCWTAAAARLTPGDLAPAGLGEAPRAQCPVCSSPPVAAIQRCSGAEAGLRYLHCGLCATEWHAVRAQCSLCGNSRGVAYLSLADAAATPGPHQSQPPPPALQAEVCPQCRGYLKLCRLERDPQADPWADDLATLALDLLVDHEGFARAGLNFLLLQSSAAAP